MAVAVTLARVEGEVEKRIEIGEISSLSFDERDERRSGERMDE